MKRLTKRERAIVDPDIEIVVAKRGVNVPQILERLAAYEDAEEQGLLIKLPCKVGDTVWWVPNLNDRAFILSDIVSGFIVEYDGVRVVLNKLDIAPYFYNSHLFFSRKEAEGMIKGENNG